MGQVISTIGALFGGGVGLYLAESLGHAGPVAWAVTVVCGLLGLVAWMYSPLPDQIGYMAGNPNTGWGWSNDR